MPAPTGVEYCPDMAIPFPIMERAASRSPGNFGVSIDQARGPLTFLVEDAHLEGAVQLLIGTVARRGDGRLRRGLPLQHPRFPGWFAERVSNAQGIGTGAQASSPTAGIGVSLDGYGAYDRWDLTVEFLPRPYALISDDDLGPQGGPFVVTWVDEDGTTKKGWGTHEWYRFCDWEMEDTSEMLAAEQGVMYFATGDTTIQPPSPGLAPQGYQFTGKPRIPIPKSLLRCFWYNVPYSYLSSPNSFLRKFKNRVNATSFAGYAAGTLLYLGVKVSKRYTPYLPDYDIEDNALVVSQDKFADFVLTWEVNEARVSGHPTDRPPWLFSSPHNCAPWFGDRYWYSIVTAPPPPGTPPDYTPTNDPTKWKSLYPLYPSEVLFTDPDVAPPP